MDRFAGSMAMRDAMMELTDAWAADATRLRKYGSGSAEVLDRCRVELRRILDDTAPTWIPLSTVQARTGWARKTLRRRFAELAGEVVPGTTTPLARMAPRWELHVSALERIGRKPGTAPVLGDDSIDQLAERLAQDPNDDGGGR
ncbi:MAG: hypothetical protein R3E10_02675 [Gemmatimonadota bacterium]